MAINALDVCRDGGDQDPKTTLGQHDSHDPTILFARLALDQPFVFQPIDEAGGPTTRENNGPCQVGGRKALPRAASQAE